MSEQRRGVTERCALSLVLAGLFGQMKYFVQQPFHLAPRLFEGAKHGRRRAWLSNLQEEARMLIQLLKQLHLDIQPGKCFHNPVVNRFATRPQEEKPIVPVQERLRLSKEFQSILEMDLGCREVSTEKV